MVPRRLAAILAADIAGYSALIGADEAQTVRDLKDLLAFVLPMISGHGGRVIDTAGDGILAEFGSVVNAVECAVAVQNATTTRSAGVEDGRRMQFRIGINIGDVIHDETRLYGDGVNVAARLEAAAEPGGICISGAAYEQVRNKLALEVGDLGLQPLRNITEPIRIYRIKTAPSVMLLRENLCSPFPTNLRLRCDRSPILTTMRNRHIWRTESSYFEAPPQIEFAADGVGYEVIGSLEAITNQVGPAT
jgi:adenylate cyclase